MTAAVAGVDGCRGGWVVVTTPLDGDSPIHVERVPDLAEVIACLDAGALQAVGIDMPIGLPEAGARRCDIEARQMIGARRSSVFPAPIRGVLESADYATATATSRTIQGKGLSRQAFGVLPRFREVDRLMTPERQQHLVEVHPELSFTTLAGAPMTTHKSRPAGRAERLRALATRFETIERLSDVRLAGTQPDDILDAFAAAVSARRWLETTHIHLGGERDERGLRMEIVA